jgi:hypothetical protein
MRGLTHLLAISTAAAASYSYDVVVYGGTPAGIAAATAAGHLGMSVALYESLPMIGGMGAAGNLALHDGAAKTHLAQPGGLAQNWSMLNAAYYNVTTPVAHPESFVANASFYTMLHGAGVQKIALDCRLTSASAGSDGSVASISVLCEPEPLTAKVFVDASYDGEVMVAVGNVDYTSGREAASKYGESLGGARPPTRGSDPVVNALRDDGSIIKYVQNISELAAPGEADDALMAFQHRLCISGDDDRVRWMKPEGYDREDFLLFERYIEASGGHFHGFGWPPANLHKFGYNGKRDKYTLCCGVTIAASDQPNLNKGWATASWEQKQKIIADHTYFELGMFYFLSHDEKVPQIVRNDFNKYGLCSDEFEEFDHIPPQLYIRESNRLVGDFVMTQNNIAHPRYQPDAIATAHWWLDMHMTGKYAVPSGDGQFAVQLEGNFVQNSTTLKPSYDVPYRLMIPKRGTGTNLFVPVCLSTSHAAFASTRIETMLMGVGTAAGVAAKQIVDGSAATVQDVNVSQVQFVLSSTFNQTLHVDAPPPNPPKYYDVAGAGDAAWNGRYMLQESKADEALVYVSSNADCPNQKPCSLYTFGGVWRLASQGLEVFYVGDASVPGGLPPPTGWSAADGSEPAPTLTAAPTSMAGGTFV